MRLSVGHAKASEIQLTGVKALAFHGACALDVVDAFCHGPAIVECDVPVHQIIVYVVSSEWGCVGENGRKPSVVWECVPQMAVRATDA